MHTRYGEIATYKKKLEANIKFLESGYLKLQQKEAEDTEIT